MPIAIRTFATLAGLVVGVTAALFAGPHLPGRFHVDDGGGIIAFALVLYVAVLVSLCLWLAGVLHMRVAMRSRFKALLFVSCVVAITYFVIVSFSLYSLSQSTGL